MISFIQSVDVHVLESLYALRDPLLVQIFIGISELGTVMMIYGLGLCGILLFILYRRYAYAAGLAITIATSGIAVLLLKGLIERARPARFFQAYYEIWYSFPSVHVALSAALYFFLAYAAWKLIAPLPLRIVVVIFLSLLVVAISFSRLYLGVHYLSDVIAGLILGTLCAWIGARWIAFARKTR